MDVPQDHLFESISSLLKIVLHVAETTANFKPQLSRLSATLQIITPSIVATVKMKRELDHKEIECKMLIDKIQKAEKLVKKCSEVEWNYFKRYYYSRNLKDLNTDLVNFFQIEVQALQIRDNTETLLVVKDTNFKVDRLSAELRDMRQRTGSVGDHGGSESIEREKYGWRVPRLPSGIVAFGEPLEKLKAAVDDCSVLVVAAPGGCGKTTLVNMLCHDAQVREKFGENIYYVTVSDTPNLMAIVGDLFNPNPYSTRLMFQSNEDAKIKLDNFLNKKAVDPMLLVLDDVWSDSFIEDIFPSKITGHKIVVTSRTAFPKYNVFRVEPLNEEDAKKLIRGAAFTEGGSRPSLAINEDLVNQMVPWCKNHPHTLSLVGGSLNGKDELAWKYVLKRLRQGRSVLDLHPDVLIRLERSFEALDDELKQCFLDFGLFPEDKRIAVSALLNMWVHLYGHDEDDTKAAISELSYRNLADLMTTRNHPGAIVNNCDQIFVTQPKYLRELAIRLNSKPPLAKRSRLIINARGENLPAYIEQVQEPMQAHILSISTEESFSSKWCNIEVPNVEVLILNLKSKAYTLPHFFAEMQNLKILDITNHDLCPTKFENFHFFGSLNNLTTIRLENVVISPSISLLVSLQKATLISCKIDNAIMEVIINRVNQQLDKTGCNHCKDLAPIPTPLSSVVHLSKNEIDAFSKALKNLMAAKPPSVPCFEKSCEFLESFWELAMVMYNKIPMIGILQSHLKDNIGIHELQNTRAIESVAD